jgi:hypothetical protein
MRSETSLSETGVLGLHAGLGLWAGWRAGARAPRAAALQDLARNFLSGSEEQEEEETQRMSKVRVKRGVG